MSFLNINGWNSPKYYYEIRMSFLNIEGTRTSFLNTEDLKYWYGNRRSFLNINDFLNSRDSLLFFFRNKNV